MNLTIARNPREVATLVPTKLRDGRAPFFCGTVAPVLVPRYPAHLLIAVAVASSGCGLSRPPVAPTIDVAAHSTCLDVRDLTTRIGNVVAARSLAPDDILIHVEAQLVVERHEVHLHVSRRDNPSVGVDRDYELRPEDCASSGRLLALAVDRFVASLPELAAPRRNAAPSPSFEVAGTGAVVALLQPAAGEARVGGLLERVAGASHITAGLHVRASWPQDLPPGRFQQSSLLASAGYRHAPGGWLFGIEARAGALLVRGLGFAENRSDILPWWEGALMVGRRLGGVRLGVELSATLLHHRAVVEGAPDPGEIPKYRLALTIEVPIHGWAANP